MCSGDAVRAVLLCSGDAVRAVVLEVRDSVAQGASHELGVGELLECDDLAVGQAPNMETRAAKKRPVRRKVPE